MNNNFGVINLIIISYCKTETSWVEILSGTYFTYCVAARLRCMAVGYAYNWWCVFVVMN